MSTSTSTSTRPLDLGRALRPQLPPGDDPVAASEIGNFALTQVNALTDELVQCAAARFDQAPASACHMNDLRAALAYAVLDWTTRWPS